MYTQGQPIVPQFPQSQAANTQYSASGIGMHSYSHEERRAFANFINELLAADPDLQGIIPIDPNTDAIFNVAAGGLLLCKLVNAIKPGTIQESRISKAKELTNKFRVIQNHNLALQGCKEIGCKVVSVGAEDIFAATPHLILGLIWQCVRISLLSKVNIHEHPELVMLLEASESVEKFMNVAPEQNLLRWFNYHLKKANHPRKVNNFSSDINDAENYLVLLSQIAPQVVPPNAHRESNPQKRAELVCQYAKQLGCGNFVTPKDILDGNEKLNLAFTAYLFNRYPGLALEENHDQQIALKEAEKLLHQQFEEEEKQRAARWQQEEDQRRNAWQLQEQQRAMQWQNEEQMRRQALEAEAGKLRALMSEQEQQIQMQRLKEEEERRAREHEAEEALRRLEEERKRLEIEREQARLAEQERQRQFEAEKKLREARRLEEEEMRREAELKRQEEERRRQFEAELLRKQEEERKKIEEEQARQHAWQEYYKQQADLARRQEEEEERKRQAAWADYLRTQDEAKRRQLEQEEQQRQAAWAQYLAQQKRQAEEMELRRLAEEEERKRQAAWADYYSRQSMMATMTQTTYQPPPPVYTVTTTVVPVVPIVPVVTTVVQPVVFQPPPMMTTVTTTTTTTKRF